MSEGSKISSIQMLRALAAALVVLTHAEFYPALKGDISHSTLFLPLGDAGVAIFFVISGFILVLIGRHRFQKSGAFGDFMIRRIIRIVPVYWFYTTVTALLLVGFPQYFNKGRGFEFGSFLSSLFFVPWGGDGVRGLPVLAVGWTLNFEMYFYVLFAMLLLFPFRMFLPMLALCLTSTILVGNIFLNDVIMFSVAKSTLVLQFLLGSAIGVFYMRSFHISQRMAGGLLATGTVGLILGFTGQLNGLDHLQSHLSDLGKAVKWGIPAGLLIAGTVFLEKAGAISVPSLLVKLGDCSYSVYLTHIFTINALLAIWVKTFNGYFSFFIVVSFLCSLFVGHMAFLLFEKPITSYLSS